MSGVPPIVPQLLGKVMRDARACGSAHDALCSCSECRKLDRKHPTEGNQLAMFDQREQRVPTEAEALDALLRLSGKDAFTERNGQRRFI